MYVAVVRSVKRRMQLWLGKFTNDTHQTPCNYTVCVAMLIICHNIIIMNVQSISDYKEPTSGVSWQLCLTNTLYACIVKLVNIGNALCTVTILY